MNHAVIDRYYASFNAGDVQGVLDCLIEDGPITSTKAACAPANRPFGRFVNI